MGPNDHVFEVGPGRGILTEPLSRRCRSVLAIEADAGLAAALRQRFAGRPRVTVVHGDALSMPLPAPPFKVFANPPFDRTADLMRALLDGPSPPEECGLVMQREAAEKHLGLGAERSTLASVLRRLRYQSQIVHRFRRGDFRPAPSVDCVMVRIVLKDPGLTPGIDLDHRKLYHDLVALAFTGGRPTVRQNLALVYGHREFRRLSRRFGFAPAATPGELTWEQWHGLFEDLIHRVDPVRRARLNGANGRRVARDRRNPKRRRGRRPPKT